MTATANEKTKAVITNTLQLSPPTVIELSADRENIFYGIVKGTTIEKLASVLAMGLKKYRLDYPKTIVFCRT
jgi:superfamily II DNA helicase RecQ